MSGASLARAPRPASAEVAEPRLRGGRTVAPWVVTGLGTAAIAAAARLTNGPLTVDDAYITFRYAEHLRQGLGLVYNRGEAVLGTTTPLYAALLALLPVPAGSLPSAALGLNAALDAAVCVLLAGLGARVGGHAWVGAVAGLGFALAPMSIAFSAGGMETPLFVLLVLGSFFLWLDGRRGWALGLAALATLTRPEGSLVAALLLLDRLRETRRLPWRLGLLYGAILAPWALFALATYGSPIPHSVTAKSLSYQPSPWLNLAALAFGAGLPGFSVLPLADEALGGLPAVTLAAVGLAALAVLGRAGSAAALRRQPRAWPLLLFAPLYALAYTLAGLRGVRMFHWYLVPLLPCYWLYVGLGLAALGARLRASPTALVAAGLVVAGLWDVAALGVSRGWLDRPTYPLGLSLARERAYTSAAVDLAPRLGADDVVAAPEIGAFGYVSGARILDTVGLVSPQATRYYPLPAEMLLGDNAVPPALIQDRQPAYVVALDQFVRRSLQPSPWFQQHYSLVARYPARVWLSDEVLVYRRVSAP